MSCIGGIMATNTKPLKQQSTDELEAAILAINAFIVALIILWLVVTGQPHVRSGQAPKAAEPETSLLVAPSIESADHETSPPAAPSIAAPQEAPPAPPTQAAKTETSPPAAPPIETAEPEALPPVAPTVTEPKDASATPTETAEPEISPSTAPTVAAPAEAPLPSPEAHAAGAAQATNGLAMLAVPEGRYAATPGVTMTRAVQLALRARHRPYLPSQWRRSDARRAQGARGCGVGGCGSDCFTFTNRSHMLSGRPSNCGDPSGQHRLRGGARRGPRVVSNEKAKRNTETLFSGYFHRDGGRFRYNDTNKRILWERTKFVILNEINPVRPPCDGPRRATRSVFTRTFQRATGRGLNPRKANAKDNNAAVNQRPRDGGIKAHRAESHFESRSRCR